LISVSLELYFFTPWISFESPCLVQSGLGYGLHIKAYFSNPSAVAIWDPGPIFNIGLVN